MDVDDSAPSRLELRRVRPSGWLLRRAILALLLLFGIVGVIASRTHATSLPDRVWVHPGDPWCGACKDGIGAYEFRKSPDGDEWHPGWCFRDGDLGLQIGEPESGLAGVLHSVERQFRNGERSYGAGAQYVLTGEVRIVDGHSWAEYERTDFQ